MSALEWPAILLGPARAWRHPLMPQQLQACSRHVANSSCPVVVCTRLCMQVQASAAGVWNVVHLWPVLDFGSLGGGATLDTLGSDPGQQAGSTQSSTHPGATSFKQAASYVDARPVLPGQQVGRCGHNTAAYEAYVYKPSAGGCAGQDSCRHDNGCNLRGCFRIAEEPPFPIVKCLCWNSPTTQHNMIAAYQNKCCTNCRPQRHACNMIYRTR